MWNEVTILMNTGWQGHQSHYRWKGKYITEQGTEDNDSAQKENKKQFLRTGEQ